MLSKKNTGASVSLSPILTVLHKEAIQEKVESFEVPGIFASADVSEGEATLVAYELQRQTPLSVTSIETGERGVLTEVTGVEAAEDNSLRVYSYRVGAEGEVRMKSSDVIAQKEWAYVRYGHSTPDAMKSYLFKHEPRYTAPSSKQPFTPFPDDDDEGA